MEVNEHLCHDPDWVMTGIQVRLALGPDLFRISLGVQSSIPFHSYYFILLVPRIQNNSSIFINKINSVIHDPLVSV